MFNIQISRGKPGAERERYRVRREKEQSDGRNASNVYIPV